ncbi:putative ERCC4-type nuclease [Tetraselmis virus 1]|uniref:ERCC4 domain-containing protein EP364R n=1 Tax=Tetraselmis virus 1 TaxID=2060617 RepID=A0A2P0VP05_9VIRU|nr:putative ERCC4-type nuclease [Tetraselmis virus 1]AUF82634.1 putative ERCC4-type nuclease [Tetraselmis virus 1]
MIILDSRETSLGELLPDAKRMELGTGDVLIGEKILVERKTVKDLAASIKDGRWRDQLARMLEEQSEKGYRPLLLIIGKLEWSEGISGEALESALTGAFVRDNIAHFRVSDEVEGASVLRRLEKRLEKNEPCSTQKLGLRKKSDILKDKRQLAVSQLSMIPGVSHATADYLIGECKTINEWIKEWECLEKPERMKVLSEKSANGKRKLGKALASKIEEYMF